MNLSMPLIIEVEEWQSIAVKELMLPRVGRDRKFFYVRFQRGGCAEHTGSSANGGKPRVLEI